MPKVLTMSGMVVAGLMITLFGLDLAAGIPFQRVSKLMDIGFLICALLLLLVSWTAKRELV